jgi:hypothetical protein
MADGVGIAMDRRRRPTAGDWRAVHREHRAVRALGGGREPLGLAEHAGVVDQGPKNPVEIETSEP